MSLNFSPYHVKENSFMLQIWFHIKAECAKVKGEFLFP